MRLSWRAFKASAAAYHYQSAAKRDAESHTAGRLSCACGGLAGGEAEPGPASVNSLITSRTRFACYTDADSPRSRNKRQRGRRDGGAHADPGCLQRRRGLCSVVLLLLLSSSLLLCCFFLAQSAKVLRLKVACAKVLKRPDD